MNSFVFPILNHFLHLTTQHASFDNGIHSFVIQTNQQINHAKNTGSLADVKKIITFS